MHSAQSHDAKTSLASSIARALAVFSVDEVVIFSDGHEHSSSRGQQASAHAAADAASGYSAFADPNHFLMHILSYLECPPHLRKALFGFHPDLRTAGACPSLDMPHHLRSDEWCRWREGVTVAAAADDRMHGRKRKRGGGTASTLVYCGLAEQVSIPVKIPPDTRVTLDFESSAKPRAEDDELETKAVDPAAPREEQGYYWGYAVRQAASVSDVLTEAPYETGYDFCVGTSERGQSVQDFLDSKAETQSRKWQHLLIVFGGVAGLEVAVRNDQQLAEKGVTEPKELFDAWLNLVPNQGSRTIRTEEAVWLGLMGLSSFVADRAEQ